MAPGDGRVDIGSTVGAPEPGLTARSLRILWKVMERSWPMVGYGAPPLLVRGSDWGWGETVRDFAAYGEPGGDVGPVDWELMESRAGTNMSPRSPACLIPTPNEGSTKGVICGSGSGVVVSDNVFAQCEGRL